jgi:uncharacterized protein with von Willebrand factor type A (vWA) domain
MTTDVPEQEAPAFENVIRADRFDHESYARALSLPGNELGKTRLSRPDLPTFPPLIEDLFLTFKKTGIRFVKPDDLTDDYQLNREALEAVVETPEHESVRASGTVGDEYLSGIATQAVATELAKRLEQAFAKQQQHQRELEELARLIASGAELDDIQQFADEHGIDDPDSVTDQAADLKDDLVDELRWAMRAGLKRAMAEVEDAGAAMMLARGWGSQQGGGASAQDPKVLAALSALLRQNPFVLEVLKQLGRYQRVMQASQKAKAEGRIKPVGVELGDDVSSVVVDELALLADEQLEDVFFYKLATKSLTQLKREALEPLGEGPIVVVVDESGSMMGSRRMWASSVVLCMIQLAQSRNRALRVIHMGTPRDGLVIDDFVKASKPDTPERIIRCVNHFFGGGTDFDYWVDDAIAPIARADPRLGKADVTLITDGDCRPSESTIQKWQKAKEQYGFRCFAVSIAAAESDRIALEAFADGVFELADAKLKGGDEGVLSTLFGI